MAVTLACEVQWLSHAAIARPAAVYYEGQFDPASLFTVDFLSMSYMLVFLIMCFPASWVLAKRGLGVGVGIGSVLVIVGSLGKALWAGSFSAQIAFQLCLAVAQPFLTNAATTLAHDWFPVRERATASGLASLAQYLGFVVALGLAPVFVQIDPAKPDYGAGVDTTLRVFAGISLPAGLFSLLVVRKGPNRQSLQDEPAFSASLTQLLRQRDFRWTFVLFLLGLGIMNTVTALTDSIAASMGVTDSNGYLGLGLILGGILGAVVLPLLSDRFGRRKLFIVLCMTLTIPALWALVLAPQGWYSLGIAAMTLLGFALMSAGPIGFQYAAEVTAPVPESVSQGLLLLAGQASGLAFTAGMSAGGSSGVKTWLLTFGLAAVAMALLALRLKESPAIAAGAKK